MIINEIQAGSRLLKVIPLALAIVVLSDCGRLGPTPEAQSAIDSNKARELGNSIANDLLRDSVKGLHQKLEKAFRDSVKEEELNSILEQMAQVYGKPMDFEFKQEELGSKVYVDGTTKAMRKLWYAAKTTKYEKGSHFLIVEVVPDGDKLAVSSFAIVNFPLGIPDTLK